MTGATVARWSAAALVAAAVVWTSGASESGRIWVHVSNPRDGQPVLGEVELAAEVVARSEVRDVVFFVDGRPVGMVSSAPYRLRLDLGEENRSHDIEVVATDVDGFEARDRVTTRPVELGFEYEVDLRQLYVTVTADGEQVAGLGRDAFTVLDDGQPQRLVTFAAGDVPFTAALLIDTSASMVGNKLEAARIGALGFVEGMRELDQAAVMTFADAIQNTTPFTGDGEVLSAGLVGEGGRGGTAAHDAIYTALKLLETRQGRRVVVLLSDGVDSHSALSGRELLEYARMSQVMVYWIRIVADSDAAGERGLLASAWRTPEEYRRNLAAVGDLVELTGGRVVPVRSPDEIRPVFVEILHELRGQYALGYYPSERRKDGSWHRLKVRVEGRGVEVRTHEGYLDL